MTAESGRERSVIWAATEKTMYCGFHESFFFRATFSHRMQINSSENTDRNGFITWNSKGCSESLRPRLHSLFKTNSKSEALRRESFSHPLPLATHVPAPVHIGLCKRDKPKSFYLDEFQLIANASIKGVIICISIKMIVAIGWYLAYKYLHGRWSRIL